MKRDSILGAMLGCMAGDAMGLLYEGLSPEKQKRLYKDINSQRFVFRNGIISDDTEHCIMVAHAILKSGGNRETFSKSLELSIKRWFLSLPYGIGFATLRSCLKLIIGYSCGKSGVFSAGNGPAMRSALIGVCYGSDFNKLKELVRISTNITHTDSKAEIGALAVALAAHLSSMESEISPEYYLQNLEELLNDYNDSEFISLIKDVAGSIKKCESTIDFANRIGLGKGVSGYMYHTVPIVIHCWLRHQNDYKSGVLEIINCGGDTDTTAAILGSIIGARVYEKGIPDKWISKIISWPYTKNYIVKMSEAVSEKLEGYSVSIKDPPIVFVLVRNLLFYPVIVYHVLRRMLPPY